MVFDYQTVKEILTDNQVFSSRIPAPPFSFIFADPPEHRRLLRHGNISSADHEGHILAEMIQQRRQDPKVDLPTRLILAEVDGERLTHAEILSFFQLLIFARQETTANLLNNSVLCLLDHPAECETLRLEPRLLPPPLRKCCVSGHRFSG
jgi:cytochrome P450